MNLKGHIALYGGSFNPPHVGHQMACLYALETLQAEELWLLPSVVHPLGKSLIAYEHRKAMLECLAQPFAGRTEICLAEQECGSSRTFDIVHYLQKKHPKQRFAWIVGADILQEKTSWYRWEDLEKMLPIVVLGRSGYASQETLLPALPQVSSSEIRRLCAQGKDISALVPFAVADYIQKHDLYRS